MTRLRRSTLADFDGRVRVPAYAPESVRPGIAHIGVGGFHRAHQAVYVDTLLGAGADDWGIVGLGLLPHDVAMRDALRDQDHLYTVVVKHGDGSREVRVVGSVVGYLFAPEDPQAALAVLTDPAVRIVSLTITEGGYHADQVTGELVLDESLRHDLAVGTPPTTAFGYLVEALARRREAGSAPFTVVSCDNVPGNGALARRVITDFARLRDPDLAAWIGAEVAFPSSMVDRITPVTADDDRRLLAAEHGVEDVWPVVCEPWTQWVLEDDFPAGRPAFELAGVQMVSDVRPYELMKLRLLNAGHQALGYLGHLDGHAYVHEAAADPLLSELVRGYMEHEATPTLEPVPGVDVAAYRSALLARFANPHVRDTLLRLCAESSDRIPKFLLPVVRHQLARGGEVRRSALVVAAWARYAEGVDERGQRIEVVDQRSHAVMERARRSRADPLVFLEDTTLFGNLRDEPAFTVPYAEALRSLHEHGARATLQRWVGAS